MKKVLSLVTSLLLCAGLLAGCSGTSSSSQVEVSSAQASSEVSSLPASEASSVASTADLVLPETVRVAALKGPTAMGMVKLMEDSENGLTVPNYEFAITTTDEIVPNITKGEVDIAAVPANIASVLYNNTDGAVQVLAINTLGVLYVVEKGDAVQSVEDLRGKTIYATGKGATPEYALNYVLTQNGIDPTTDVTIEYKSEAAEILPLLAQNEDAIAILPQPFVTSAMANVEGLRVALDWTQEWDAVAEDGSSLVTGVVVVRTEFAQEYPDAVAAFCEEYAASTAYAQTNVEETAALIGEYGIVDAAIAEVALPACNITYIDGDEMQVMLSGYLAVLFAQEPTSVGGTLPDEAFYYKQ